MEERNFSVLLEVPIHVLMDFLYKAGINLGQKVLSIITNSVTSIYSRVWLICREIGGQSLVVHFLEFCELFNQLISIRLRQLFNLGLNEFSNLF